MSSAVAILRKGSYVGIREIKAKISRFVRKGGLTFITDRGQPRSVLVPYKWLLRFLDEKGELEEILGELKDERLLQEVGKGRKRCYQGGWVPADHFLAKWSR